MKNIFTESYIILLEDYILGLTVDDNDNNNNNNNNNSKNNSNNNNSDIILSNFSSPILGFSNQQDYARWSYL